MQFEVPQFIEIEDKIFGPLTWRQFLYVSGGGLMSVVLFLTTPFIVFVLFGVPIGVLAGALAFYPVNNRPFSHLLEAIYSFLTRERLYHWRQRQDIVYKQERDELMMLKNPLQSAGIEAPRRDIASLARKLELDALQKK